MNWSPREMERLFNEELLPLFQTLVRNACVNDGRPESGQEVRSADTLEAYFSKSGLVCQRWEPVPGRVSLQTELPGEHAAPVLTFMCHTDVVPARSEDWLHPPFGAEIHDGQVWGRGTVDMLCWTAAQAVAVAALARLKNGPRRCPLKYLALADEEASGIWGARYLTENFWDSVKCDVMVTELGGFFLEGKRGKTVVFTVAEKGVCWLRLTWKGRAGHGSIPYRADNALLKASLAASILAAWEAPLEDSPLVRDMTEAMRCDPNPGYLERMAPGLAAFLHTAGRTTISPNFMVSGDKVNIIPDRAELLLDIRFLEADCPGGNSENVVALVRHILGPELEKGLTTEVLEYFAPNQSPIDGPVPRAIRTILEEAEPGAVLMPTRIGGVTDGRYWRARGVPVYGFLLFATDFGVGDYAARIHAANERLSLASLRRNLDFCLNLPLKL